MTVFGYRAVDLERQASVEGAVEAQDEREARQALRARGLLPLAVKPFDAAGRGEPAWRDRLIEALTFRPVKTSQLALYIHQLAALLEAGMPIVGIMSLLESQTTSPSLRAATRRIRQDLLTGMPLAECLERHPRVFPPLFVSLVAAGEASGHLATMVARMAEMLEKDQEIRRKIKTAMAYPLMVLAVLVGVVALLLAFVVPAFSGLCAKTGALLPLPTRMLLALSDVLRHQGAWIGLAALVALGGYHWYRRTPVGRPLVDRAWMSLPVMGPLLLHQAANTFTRAFGTVYGAGVPVVSALASCRRVVDNQAIAELIVRVEEDVKSGLPLADRLIATPLFPSMLAHMIAIGEASGELEALTAKAVAFSDRQIDYQIKQMTAMIEPAMTLFMGLVVAFVAMALYLPLFDMPRLITGG